MGILQSQSDIGWLLGPQEAINSFFSSFQAGPTSIPFLSERDVIIADPLLTNGPS
jgi:hypothetical protein